MAAITSTGLGSGLDIKSLVSSLVSAENTPATLKLDKQETLLTTQISSYGSLKSAMSTFQTSLSGLKNLSTFQKLNATSSDPSSVTASTFSNADPGTYNLEVKQLAKNHALSTAAYSSATDVVGTGTLTIKFGTTDYTPASVSPGAPEAYNGFVQDGTKATLSLTIDPSNNTLAGISDAINKAKAGVTAVVVTDISGSRLVLNSTETGAKSSMEISVTDTGDGIDTDASGLSALAFNATATSMTQHQAAQDAQLAINGLDIVSPSNTVNTAIKGMSFNLQQAQIGKIVTVGVSQNNDDIAKAVEGFVKSYNDLITIVKPLTNYDAATQKAGLLQGDSILRSAMGRLRSELGNMVSGLSGSAKSLADLGIRTSGDGTLALNSTQLNSQLASNRLNVTGIFAVLGVPSNSNVSFSSSTTDTKAGQYALNITQVAAQGVLNGTLLSSLVVAPGAETFAIKVDGTQSGTISLTPKTYTSYAELATEMQSRINGDSTIKASGVSVGVTYDGTKMVFTSKSYGATSQVEITENTTALVGLGSGTAGQDVVGSIGGLPPTQGVLKGGSPTSLTIGTGTDTFAIKVNGTQSGTIALTQQTYASYADLATEMQTRINADSDIKASGAFVTVTYDATTPGSEHMVITSKSYGASSQVELTANTTPLGLTIGKGVVGIGPTGKGRELTSTSGDSQGLKLLISDNVIGAKGTIDFSRGLIERLDKLMSGAVGTTGTFNNRTNGLQKNLDNVTKERTKLAARMSALETRLYNRFNKMDLLLGQMQSTSSYLTQQFASKSTNN